MTEGLLLPWFFDNPPPLRRAPFAQRGLSKRGLVSTKRRGGGIISLPLEGKAFVDMVSFLRAKQYTTIRVTLSGVEQSGTKSKFWSECDKIAKRGLVCTERHGGGTIASLREGGVTEQSEVTEGERG